MNIAAIGVGGAGGRIVDRLAREFGTGASSPLVTVHAIDTDRASLDALGAVPNDARHAIGQFETGGEGTDGDREQAAGIVEDERMEIRRTVEDAIPTTVDAIVIAAGLAGGTGSAVTPALAGGLATVYEQPVYTVSVLPAEEETDDQRRANTAQALTGLEEGATAQIVFDNDAWLYGSRSLEVHSDRINAELTARLGELFTIGDESSGAIGERVVDTQDVLATVAGGNLVTLGYASRPISAWRGAGSSLFDGLKRRVLGDDTDEFERGLAIQRTLGWATRGTMTFECPRTAATHGLVVFRGPPEWLRGDAISKGRKWLADRAGIERLRSGDVPADGAASLDVFVVLAGIEQAPRIEAFRRDGSGTEQNGEGPEQSDDTEAPSVDETTGTDGARVGTDETGGDENGSETGEPESVDSGTVDAAPDAGVDDSDPSEESDEPDEAERGPDDASGAVPPGETTDDGDSVSSPQEADSESADEGVETDSDFKTDTDERDSDENGSE